MTNMSFYHYFFLTFCILFVLVVASFVNNGSEWRGSIFERPDKRRISKKAKLILGAISFIVAFSFLLGFLLALELYLEGIGLYLLFLMVGLGFIFPRKESSNEKKRHGISIRTKQTICGSCFLFAFLSLCVFVLAFQWFILGALLFMIFITLLVKIMPSPMERKIDLNRETEGKAWIRFGNTRKNITGKLVKRRRGVRRDSGKRTKEIRSKST